MTEHPETDDIEWKLDFLKTTLGVDPKRLYESNPLFVQNILRMISRKTIAKGSGHPLPTPFLDDANLAKMWAEKEAKNKGIILPPTDEQAKQVQDAKDKIDLKYKPKGKWNTKGKFRKK